MFGKRSYPRGNHPKSNLSASRDRQSTDRPASSATNSSANNYGAPLVSPLQMTFDFELPQTGSESPFRVSAESFVRPKTSDGALGASAENRSSSGAGTASGLRKSTVSLAPPILPPIPRVASTNGSLVSKESRQNVSANEEGAKSRDESDNISVSSRSRSQASRPTVEHPVDLPTPLSRPTSSGGVMMQDSEKAWTAGGTTEASDAPRMQSSLFPSAPRPDSPQLPEIDTGPAMTREFIDSRDRPYSSPVARPPQSSQAAPPSIARNTMLSVQTQNANAIFMNRSALGAAPISPAIATPTSANSLRLPKISGARLSPNSSVEDLRAALQRAPSTTTTVTAPISAASGSAAANRKSSYSSASKGTSPATPSSQTIGTPYGETSSAFPLPQHVATRPKTGGATATVAGVNVPTHHTSARPTISRNESSDSAPKAEKSEKRRTRLLNPMALLTRKKSSQDAVVVDKSAAAQAYARQKSVAAVGVNELPRDYVGIKGKVVHDFSAPRPTRGLSYDNTNEMLNSPALDRQLQSAGNVPSVPLTLSDPSSEQPPFHAHQASDGSGGPARRSVHSPVFREMLAEDPDVQNRVSSLNAERLENKDFLNRVSNQSSHTSNFSQESAVLPPFARRSQQLNLDPMQASFYNDVESKRSSDQSGSGRGERSSGGSSVAAGPPGTVSPITARSSHGAAMSGEARSSLGMQSMSPVSPTFTTSPEVSGKGRPMSSTSANAANAQNLNLSLDNKGLDMDETTTRPSSGVTAQPSMTPVAEDAPWSSRGRSQYRDSAVAPEAVVTSSSGMSSSLALPPSSSSHSLSPGPAIPDRTSSRGTTPDATPEISQAEFARPVSTIAAGGVKVVEKRASAVGHAKRASLKPKHQASNASRFSFQFGGESAAEEEKLEEKHRKIKGKSQDFARSRSPDEDDDDDFDEDAMDDMDEFEVQQQHTAPPIMMSANAPWIHPNSSTGLLGVQQGMRLAESTDGSDYDSEEDDDGDAVVHPGYKPADSEQTYADHPDFMAHYRSGSKATIMTYGSTLDHYLQGSNNHGKGQLAPGTHDRDKSIASALTVNTDILGASKAPVQVGTDQGYDVRPQAAGYSLPAVSGPPPLPPREVKPANSDERQSRRISGTSLVSPKSRAERASKISSLQTIDAEQESHDQVRSPFSVRGSDATGFLPSTEKTNSGLGLSGFQGFKFSDDSTDGLVASRLSLPKAESERPRTSHGEALGGSGGWAELARQGAAMNSQQPLSSTDATTSRFTHQANANVPSSDGMSKAYRGSVGKHIRARNKTANQNLQYAHSESENDGDDDMYFDDGGFEQDIKHSSSYRVGRPADEDKIDEDGYLPRINQHAMGPRNGGPGPGAPGGYHQRDTSAISIASLGADGPYPSFAMGANPVKQIARQSQMLLEDLPLQGPVDPKLIPQRNPSEDAKRLGLSDRVPPLPVQQGGDEAAARRMQTNLAAYHAALAEAANRAQEEGRFARMPSVASTTVSGSLKTKESFDDRSFYSRDDGAGRLTIGGGDGVSRSASNLTRDSDAAGSKTSDYSPPKMSFDFGFDESQPQRPSRMDYLEDHSYVDDFGTEDDIVAAANAEALANDEDGFYGSEFGFYAKARANSADAEAINGGFFGEDGDDGLARNRSGKEPNLTPITERSEFSTRNSFINLGHGGLFGPASAGMYGPSIGPGSPALARMPVTPIVPENDVANFDQLRKLRANAFGGSNGSLRSAASHGRNNSSIGSNAGLGVVGSPASTKSPTNTQGYFGPLGGTTMAYGYSDHGSSHSAGSSSNPSSAHPSMGAGASGFEFPPRAWMQGDNSSPRSSSSGYGNGNVGGQQQFSSPLANAFDFDATPRKAPPAEASSTARKASAGEQNGRSHSRQGSTEVTYVKDRDPVAGRPQWVLERRRTGEQGQSELVGREVVQGGWI